MANRSYISARIIHELSEFESRANFIMSNDTEPVDEVCKKLTDEYNMLKKNIEYYTNDIDDMNQLKDSLQHLLNREREVSELAMNQIDILTRANIRLEAENNYYADKEAID